MQIRKLSAGDVRIFAGVLAKNMDVIQSLKTRPGESADDYQVRLGVEVVGTVLTRNLQELWSWLASMANLSTEEFDKLGPGAPFDVVESVLKDGELSSFFARVRDLLPKEPEKPEESGI